MHTINKFQHTNDHSDLKFSIIIPSWNNLAFLKLVIQSIQKNSRYQHQIIVHINEGIDGTLDWVKSQNNLDYTHSEDNIGICYPLNIARQLLKTDYLVYMNDDMYVCPDWDYHFDEEIKSIPHNNFFLSGTLIEAQSSNISGIEKDFGRNIDSFREDDLLKAYKGFNTQDWNGATWPINIVHKDTWDLIGGYSVEYTPGFYSDPDFSKKLWDFGVRHFKGMSKSLVYHFPSQSTKRIKRPNKGRVTFLLKWGMTASFFFKHYLKMGTAFEGTLPEVSKKSHALHKIKSVIEILKQ